MKHRHTTNSFGIWIRQARERAGLTQADVAARLGMNRPMISRLEGSTFYKRGINIVTAAEICDLYGISLTDFAWQMKHSVSCANGNGGGTSVSPLPVEVAHG